MAGGVVISFLAKTADAVADVRKLDRTLDNVKGTATKAGGGIGKWVKGLAIGVPIVGAVTAGVVGLAEGLIDAAKAGAEDERQARKLAHTLSNIPGITQEAIDKNAEWIDSMELATLVSDTDLRNAVGKLAQATGDLGEAQKLAALATDVAAESGKSYATVADALAKAAAGNTAQLERMFPWLDKNKDGTVSLAEATEGLGDKFKGAAGEAAKNDPWKRIGVIWGQLKEQVNKALQPSLDRLGDWFKQPQNVARVQKMIKSVGDLGEKVGVWLLAQLEKFLKWIESAAFHRAVITWKLRFDAIVESVRGAIRYLESLYTLIQKVISVLTKIPRGPLGLIPGGFSSPTSAGVMSGPTATTTATTAAPTPPTVIVTEEQVYRAVQRLLLRGDARNGRLVMVR